MCTDTLEGSYFKSSTTKTIVIGLKLYPDEDDG